MLFKGRETFTEVLAAEEFYSQEGRVELPASQVDQNSYLTTGRQRRHDHYRMMRAVRAWVLLGKTFLVCNKTLALSRCLVFTQLISQPGNIYQISPDRLEDFLK